MLIANNVTGAYNNALEQDAVHRIACTSQLCVICTIKSKFCFCNGDSKMINIWSRNVKIILTGLAFVIAVAGCDTVEGMRDMKDTQEQLKAIVKEAIGIEPFVGINMISGVLIDVSITLNAKDVADRSVPELERVARAAVKTSFESKPRVIYIQIATTAD